MFDFLKKTSSPRRTTRDLTLNIFLTLLLATIFTIINPNFINRYNLISIGQSLAPYALLTLGVIMPISMGGTDLSIGAVCIGSAVFAGTLYNEGMPLVCVIPVMILFGALFGLINGVLIAKHGLQPFIATLGTMMLVRGATAIFAGTANVLFPSGTWYNDVFSNFNGFPISFFWIIAFSLLIWYVYKRTRFGRYMASIGSNEKATRISGVDVVKVKMLGYTVAGAMAGVAAIFWSASFATVAVATGNGMELDAMAGAYIGGNSATGGLANVFGGVIGAIMLVIIRSGLNFALARLDISVNSTYVTYVISGIIVVAAVLSERVRNSKIEKAGHISLKKRTMTRATAMILSVIMGVFLVLSGCGLFSNSGDNEAVTQEQTLCIVMKADSGDFWSDIQAGAQQAGEDYGYTVICRGTESEDSSYLPKQREIISTLLSDNPAGIAISAVADGLTDLLEEAYKRGVPAIQYDSGLRSEDVAYMETSDANPLLSYVKADNYANAALGAEAVFNAIRDDIVASDGTYLLGIIQHENSDTAEMRTNGFRDRFTELCESDPETAGKAEILVEVKPSNANNAYKEALEFLFEKGVKTVFCTNTNVVNQVADAVTASGGKYDSVKFAGFDTGDKANEWIASDSLPVMLGVVSQDAYLIGYRTSETMALIANGETVDSEVLVTGKWVNAENLAEVTGYTG